MRLVSDRHCRLILLSVRLVSMWSFRMDRTGERDEERGKEFERSGAHEERSDEQWK